MSATESAEREAGGRDAPETPASEQQAEAKAYGRQQLHCTIADTILDLAYLAFFAFFFALALDRWLLTDLGVENRWLRLAVYFLAMSAGQFALSLPLSWYSGYSLEHRYGLSRQSPARWFGRLLLQQLLAVALSLLLVEGLYLLIEWTGSYWWICAAIASFLVTVVLGQLAPVLILPLFYKLERLDQPELLDRFQRLAAGTGLRIQGVFRIGLSRETAKANAMLAGLGRTRRVILGDTLLDGFTPDEIEVVLAHEIGHHVYRHITKFLVAGLVFSVLAFLCCDAMLRFQVPGHGYAWSYAELPVWTLSWIMLAMGILSTVFGPLRNAVSRRFERQCDRYALDRTGLRDAFRSAFRKLAAINKADMQPHPAEVLLFHDHPPIAQRLAIADCMAHASRGTQLVGEAKN